MPDKSDERHMLVVNAEMTPAFVDWYRTVHVPEVIAAVPGYGGAAFLQAASFQPTSGPADLRPHLTLIEIHGDPEKVFGEVSALRAAGRFTAAPSAGRPYQAAALFRPVGSAEVPR